MSVRAGLECFTQEDVEYEQLWLFRVLAPLALLAFLLLLGFGTRLDRDRMVHIALRPHPGPILYHGSLYTFTNIATRSPSHLIFPPCSSYQS